MICQDLKRKAELWNMCLFYDYFKTDQYNYNQEK